MGRRSSSSPAWVVAVLLAVGRPAVAAAGECGDAVRDADELCDLGIGNEVGLDCTTRCEPPRCGDGIVDLREACDDGNAVDRDGCSAACQDETRPIWSSSVDLGGRGGEAFTAVASTPAGYVAVGGLARTELGDTQPLVAGFDPDGAPAWTDTPWSSAGQGAAHAVMTRGDDIWVVGAVVDLVGDTRPMLWRYQLDGFRAAADELAMIDGDATIDTIVALDDGRVIVGGAHTPPGLLATGWLGAIDLDAASLDWWIDLPAGRRPADLAPMADGRIAVAGRRSSRAWVGVLDAAGAEAWSVDLADDGRYPNGDWASAVAVGTDGTILAAGARSAGIVEVEGVLRPDTDGWVGAFAPDGEVLWVRNAGDLGTVDRFSDLVVVDGTPVAIGERSTVRLASPSWTDRDVWMQQVDADGELGWTWSYDGAMHHVDQGFAAMVDDDDDEVIVVGSSVEPFGLGNAWIGRVRPTVAATPRRHASPRPADALAQPRGAIDEPSLVRSASSTTLYLDFDGATLRPGDRGDLGGLSCLSDPVPYPGVMIDEAQAQSIADRIAVGLSPFGIHVRWGESLPPHLPRTTVVFGGLAEQLGLDASATGYACNVDCGDTWAWDLALVFDAGPSAMANTAMHEAAHTWGLDHVVDASQLMYPQGAAVDADWGSDTCTAVTDLTSPVLCSETHAQQCPEGGQNSHAELLALFGPARVDLGAPELLLSVESNALSEGEPAVVTVERADDAGTPGLRLSVPELQWARVIVDAETRFSLALPRGSYTIVAEAVDHAGNAVSDARAVVVGDASATTGSGDVGSTSETSTGAGPDDVSHTDDGCGCRARDGRAGGVLVFVVVVAGTRRRTTRIVIRRRARS